MSEQASQQDFSPEDKELLRRLLSRPLILPPEFKSWLYRFASWDAMPYFQELLGTEERRWHVADPVPQLETCSSTSFVDLATVGPQLTGLANGRYMVVFGFYTQDGTAGTTRYARVEYNNQTGSPVPSPDCDVYQEGQAVMFNIVDLGQDDANSIKLRYRVSSGSANFRARWLHAVQVV